MIILYAICWVNKEFLSPVKIALLCPLVLDLKGLDFLTDINFVTVFTINFIDDSC